MKAITIRHHEAGHCYAVDEAGHTIIASDECAVTREDPVRLLIDLWDLGFVSTTTPVSFQGVWGSMDMEDRARRQYTAKLVARAKKRIADLDNAVRGHGLRWPLPDGMRSDLQKLAKLWPEEK